MTQFKIISAITDGTTLSLSAEGCIQIGTRTEEGGRIIPITSCRNVGFISVLETDLPETGKLNYIKQKVEEAYAELPDLSVVKQLIGKQWTT